MSNILVDESGKGNLCCSKSIDIERGCTNRCIGCYGTKTSMMGIEKYFNHVVSKEFDEKAFRKSVKSAIKAGYKYARLGKHSDCGHSHLLEILKQVLKIAGEEGLRLVFVSKSLKYDEEIAELLFAGDHTLHMSLGMITQAPSDIERLKVFHEYNCLGYINAKLRVVGDVTKQIPDRYRGHDITNWIVTPMRFTSKEVAAEYEADLSKYEWINGYYRPKEVHVSWSMFEHWCGEVNNEVRCCGCLVEVNNED